ncbi:LOB domain-containing protein 38-like [Gastrolobium bilobum]|uniref:LOB domain-containing protein 38-like n=1 Tax=Gastrolobium bilobum TaxID=150636 RepID=UPI002AB01C07|nr:LOB domain-containing protein 38-like [Gastrolobium bilobum]
MSCNGCRVLRKGCSEGCTLRSCLQWIDSPEAQGHATLFVAKFFGRSDLISFISSVPPNNRPALFQSLLFEACGRTINPVNGAVGLMWSGNWHVCQAAVDTVLSGGVLRPLPEVMTPTIDESSDSIYSQFRPLEMIQESYYNSTTLEALNKGSDATPQATSLVTGESEMTSYDIYSENEKKLLNLFV